MTKPYPSPDVFREAREVAPAVTPTSMERLERAALVLILAAVATLAGKVAFFRVVDWTMANSPDATPLNAGWTNGVISELLPIGALLYIRHQKRHGRTPGILAWAALVGAFLFSLTAQLAQAQPSVFGWVVAAMPSAAFMVLSKMVVSMRPAHRGGESAAGNGEVVATVAAPTVAVGSQPEGSGTAGAKPEPRAQPGADVTAEPASEPQPAVVPISEPEAPVKSEPRRPHRVRARSLTSAAKVEKAAKELGSTAMPAAVAARAGVSESTARRYMPKAA